MTMLKTEMALYDIALPPELYGCFFGESWRRSRRHSTEGRCRCRSS